MLSPTSPGESPPNSILRLVLPADLLALPGVTLRLELDLLRRCPEDKLTGAGTGATIAALIAWKFLPVMELSWGSMMAGACLGCPSAPTKRCVVSPESAFVLMNRPLSRSSWDGRSVLESLGAPPHMIASLGFWDCQAGADVAEAAQCDAEAGFPGLLPGRGPGVG